MPTFMPDPEEQRARRQGALALVFFGLALVTVYLPAEQQRQVAATLRASVLRPFIATQSALARARLLTSETGRLQREVDSLVSAITNRSALAEENRRLRALLDLSRKVGRTYRAASVLRPGTAGSESMFLVDVGRRDGVRPGAPVIMEEGLVGVIRDAGEHTSIGMDWTHPDFRASAMSLDGEAYGIVEPRRGDFREVDRLQLSGAPYHSPLDTGSMLVTSGRGGVYPRGIPIGTVEGLADAEGGWRKSYWIRPAVRVGTVTHVLVEVPGAVDDPRDMAEAMLDSAGLEVAPGPLAGPDSGVELREPDSVPPPSEGEPADDGENDDGAPPQGSGGR